MLNIFTLIFLIIMSGILDRVRGDNFGYNRVLEKLLYGYCILLISNQTFDLFSIPIIILFAVGSSFSWGQPFGNYLTNEIPKKENKEWFQIGNLWNMPFTSLIIRGFLWGLPVLSLAYWNKSALIIGISFIIAFPLSAFVIKHTVSINKRWEATETFRGFIGAMLVLLLSYL